MKHKIEHKWYVPQCLVKGVWVDGLDQDNTLREARSEITNANCCGHKARIIERISAFRVISKKDFR